MRYYLVVGEKSGDMYGSMLIQALQQEDPRAVFRCLGGTCMKQITGRSGISYTDLATMGLDFLISLRKLYQSLRYCKQDILSFQPDVVILIDYAGIYSSDSQVCAQARYQDFLLRFS